MTINERLTYLRNRMKEEGIDAYLVVSDDFHGSEYVGDYFKCREYISGFTGSAGSVIITQDTAGLWTDGRYFLQAERELEDSEMVLYKMGQEGVPSAEEYLCDTLQEGQCLGIDGRTVSDASVQKILSGKKLNICSDQDLVSEIWTKRPALSAEPAFRLAMPYAGCSAKDKIKKVRTIMQEKEADLLVLTTLDDIAWLFNLRGNDIKYCPVMLSYTVISQQQILLFADQASFSPELEEELRLEGIYRRDYGQIYRFMTEIQADSTVMLDRKRTNYAILQNIPAEVRVLDVVNPTYLLKAVKNETEVRNERIAHIKDGVAVTKFLCWLHHNKGRIPITEISAAERLEEFRKEEKHYIGPSFAPISAYGPHGAVVHYSATQESNLQLSNHSFLLMDTGGHYLEGSTDITRTVSLGALSKRQKEHYTAVLRGNLNLAAAKFLHGSTGVNLDYPARQPLWEMGLDYQHGTGHGVGYLLSVHEGPNSIRWRMGRNPEDDAILEEGMITSNEPGVYLSGEYGIRLENLMLCLKAEKNEYGQFMQFEPLTMVPFDLKSILPVRMSERERELLNAYHKTVFQNLSPYLNEVQKLWLKEATTGI